MKSYGMKIPGRILRSESSSTNSQILVLFIMEPQPNFFFANIESRHCLIQQRHTSFACFSIVFKTIIVTVLFFFPSMIENAREAPFPASFITYDLSSVAVSSNYDVLKLGTPINAIL